MCNLDTVNLRDYLKSLYVSWSQDIFIYSLIIKIMKYSKTANIGLLLD